MAIQAPRLVPAPESGPAHVLARARSLWPRLDGRRLARTGGDPRRVARLVSERSGLPVELIEGMLRAE